MSNPLRRIAGPCVAASALAVAPACIGPSQPTFTDEEFGSAGAGSLQVLTVTRGQNHDPDGYLISIDEGRAETVPANGSVTFEELRGGEWLVMIGDIATNCTLAGSESQSATVVANSTATVSFLVDCV